MRSCLPLTILNQQLVDNAELSPEVQRELLLNETERQIIAGTRSLWDEAFAPVKASDVVLSMVDFSELELRLLSTPSAGPFLHNARPTGRITTSRPSIQYSAMDALATWRMVGLMGTSVSHVRCDVCCPICQPSDFYTFPAMQHVPDVRSFVHNYDALFER